MFPLYVAVLSTPALSWVDIEEAVYLEKVEERKSCIFDDFWGFTNFKTIFQKLSPAYTEFDSGFVARTETIQKLPSKKPFVLKFLVPHRTLHWRDDKHSQVRPVRGHYKFCGLMPSCKSQTLVRASRPGTVTWKKVQQEQTQLVEFLKATLLHDMKQTMRTNFIQQRQHR